jgi:YfiH family protein
MTSATPGSPALADRHGLDVLTWPSFAGLPVDAVVTTRAGGVSTGGFASLNLGLDLGDDPGHVAENRRRAAAAIGCGAGDMVFARQVHGRGVAIVDRPAPGETLAADALVTATPGLGLAVKVADCTPLVLYDPGARVLGCVHAGWRGTTQRVAEAAVTAMTALGATPAALVAGIGPSIAADRYQVGDEVAEAARACFGPGADDVLRPDGTGRWTFDLVAANRRVLVDAGVRPGRIEAAPAVTGPGTPFFSHRAEGPCGRFALLARLHPRRPAP